MHRYTRIASVLLVVIMVIGPWLPARAEEEMAKKEPVLAALVYGDVDVMDDNSFVAAVNSGAQRAVDEFGIDLDIYTKEPGEQDYTFMKGIAQQDVDVIIAVSFPKVEPLLDLAEEFPDVKFIVIDAVIPPLFTNAKSIIFREHEGSFLVGMIAALKSKTGTIGFVGGRDIPLIRNFLHGYTEGAQHVNPDIKILDNMVGTTIKAWENPKKGKSLAEKQFAKGADIIFHAAGASGMGVLEAAAEMDKLAIGVDSNQNGLFPGHVLTSMVKKVDVAVYEGLKEVHTGNWDAGILNLGLKEKAIDYAVDVHNRQLLDEALISIVETARSQIIRGNLEVGMYAPN